MAAQEHIQAPQDGNTATNNFTASGSVRPSSHSVTLRLTTINPMQTSVDTNATVNSTTGSWTAGPFRDAGGNLLNPAIGGVLTALSTFNGVNQDTDSVTSLTIN